MSRVETIGNAVLYLGDMRDIVPDLPIIDMIFMDLPYKLTSGGNSTGQMGGKFSKESYNGSGKIINCDIQFSEIMPLVARILPEGHAYFMVNNRYVSHCQNEAEKAGFHFHNLLVWDKGTGTPNRWYMKNCEFTVFVKKGGEKYINDCGSRQLIKCPNILNSFHKTEKPVALIKHYIRNSTHQGQVVFDGCMGVAPAGTAAINLGRKFIGIELVEKNFDEACRRVEKAYLESQDMFEGFSHLPPLPVTPPR